MHALVTYESETAKGLRLEFESAVEDYLSLCEEQGATPEKPYRGLFNVRTSPNTHRWLAQLAAAKGLKLNAVVNEALERYLETAGKSEAGPTP